MFRLYYTIRTSNLQTANAEIWLLLDSRREAELEGQRMMALGSITSYRVEEI